jgi:ParB family transcriptional regulator, chromosome partitioning protein
MSAAGGKARLGRGLGALLGEDYLTAAAEPAEIRTLPLIRIVPNPFQPRREFREEELADLARSIAENGLLQPILVRPSPAPGSDRYELVAGERRFRAITSLGWSEVPVVVRPVDDRTLLVLALVENIQREALNPLEEAEGFQLLADDFGLTQGEIAEAVGRNRSTVANTLRLLRLPPTIRRYLEDGSLSMGHARALLAIEDPGRLVEVGRRAATEGWTVREVEARARTEGNPKRSPSSHPRQPTGAAETGDPALSVFEEALRESLGTRVRLRVGRKGHGTVEIPFLSSEDFERIFSLITGRDTSDVTG